MSRLRKAIIAILQEEADTWAGPTDIQGDHLELILGYNEAFPDAPISLYTDVNWHE